MPMEPNVIVPILAEVHARRGVAADRLPYTDVFEDVYEEVTRRTGEPLSRAEFWRIIANARKRGALPRVSG
jgi:hypothetical protein